MKLQNVVRFHSLVKIFGMVQKTGKSLGAAWQGWAGSKLTDGGEQVRLEMAW
jgi:hypothetical protein